MESPFWSRLLIAKDRKSSNVILFMRGGESEKLVARLERIVHESDTRDFRIHIAGTPYVVEMLKRSITHDFHYFSLTAVVLFGITMAAMFRSAPRFFWECSPPARSAVLLTLLLQQMFGRQIGILTVNLGIIVFVVAMSHLVYMTFNWQMLADRRRQLDKKSPDLARDALRMTFPPSFWSMVCASLGFASLLIVEAKPLPRARIRRRARIDRGFCLRLRDVSAVSALGDAARKQNRRSRAATQILVAKIPDFFRCRHYARAPFWDSDLSK